MKSLTNLELAELLRKVAAAYQILNDLPAGRQENRFKIIAYDRAADSIEHLTSDAKDLWDDGKLSDVPGIGEGISHYLDELFKTGNVKHFNHVMKRVPQAVFPLLLIPGIGPKKAHKLVSELGIRDSAKDIVGVLAAAAKAHKIAPIEGFGEKSEEDILAAIETYKKGAIKENRMELPIADSIAQDVIAHLKKNSSVERVDVLGSLRRQVSTIGDIDIAAATKKPDAVVEHFVTYPHQKLIEKGSTGASLLLHSGRQVDLRVQDPAKYGAMLQYFTGSKNHNIQLRSYALEKGSSLSEHGIKKGGTLQQYASEEALYKAIGLPWIPPELREDKGEIEAAIHGNLPHLVELKDIKGDLHIHTDHDLKPSHDLGKDPITAYIKRADHLGYEYIGISDHNPKTSGSSTAQIIQIMKKRHEFYEKESKGSRIHVFIMCEVDIQPDGALALPTEAFEFVDAVIVSIHSSFTQPKLVTTKRVVKALTAHPKVRIFGHPTGRLLTRREGVEIEWKEVFTVCRERDIALEINAHPMRLDLPDTIVYDARRAGIKFCINTDSHEVGSLTMMRYGVSVARRGWCEKGDIVNTMEYNDFKRWLIRQEGL